MRGLHPKQVNLPHNWYAEDTKSYTNFPELARDMPQVWTCKFNSKTWMIKQLVTKSPTAILRNAMVHCAVWMIPGQPGNIHTLKGACGKQEQDDCSYNCFLFVHNKYCPLIISLTKPFTIYASFSVWQYILHTIRKCKKMAGQNTFQILLLDDANMIGEH